MNKIVVIILMVCIFNAPVFSMPVPSGGSDCAESDTGEYYGGREFSQEEIILMIVGIVCGTVLLLGIFG